MQKNFNIPANAAYILSELYKNGFEGYIVGGCVRDHLLGKQPKDWDITTNALPDRIKEIFDGKSKSHTVDTGIQHGTVTVIIDHIGYEVTTYRIDGEYKDSRHPESVIFTDRINDDLARRDFTMNAIAYAPEKGFVDPYGGITDISNGLIRAVGTPADRFDEDALRIMRALRFSAQLGFSIEDATYAALEQKIPLLKNISTERIRDEFTKLIMTDKPGLVKTLWELGITKIFMPKAVYRDQLPALLDASLCSLPLRLALILEKTADTDITKMLKALTFDGDTARTANTIINSPPVIQGDAYSIRRLINRTGPDISPLAVDYQSLVMDWGPEKTSDIRAMHDLVIENGDCCAIGGLAINGKDLISAGIPKGKAIGEMLEKALDAVMHDPELNTKDKLFKYLQIKT